MNDGYFYGSCLLEVFPCPGLEGGWCSCKMVNELIKGSLRRVSGDLLAETEYSIHKYVVISV